MSGNSISSTSFLSFFNRIDLRGRSGAGPEAGPGAGLWAAQAIPAPSDGGRTEMSVDF